MPGSITAGLLGLLSVGVAKDDSAGKKSRLISGKTMCGGGGGGDGGNDSETLTMRMRPCPLPSW